MSRSIPSISKASANAMRSALASTSASSSSSSSSFFEPRPRFGVAFGAPLLFFAAFLASFSRSFCSFASFSSIASFTKSRFISTMARYSLFDAQELMIRIPGGGGGVDASVAIGDNSASPVGVNVA